MRQYFKITDDNSVWHIPSGKHLISRCNSRKCAKNVIELALEQGYDWSKPEPLGDKPDWDFYDRIKLAAGRPENRIKQLSSAILEARN